MTGKGHVDREYSQLLFLLIRLSLSFICICAKLNGVEAQNELFSMEPFRNLKLLSMDDSRLSMEPDRRNETLKISAEHLIFFLKS